MAIRPKVVELKPEILVSLRPQNLVIRGEEFQNGATLRIVLDTDPPTVPPTVITPAVTFVSENELRTVIPDTIVDGDHSLQVINLDGGVSNFITMEVYPLKSALDDYINPSIDMRVQPLDPPFNTREYPQRILAANQFTGTLPNAAQGDFGDVAGPTRGGRWAWAEDVLLEQVTFRSNGVEPVPRGAGSGLYVHERNGAEVFLLDLGTPGPYAQSQHVFANLAVQLKQGDELLLRTNLATLEMIFSPTVRINRPYL